MQVHITHPVVISSAAGLRHLAPGLIVELTDAEASQVMRQKAGSVCGSDLGETSAKPSKAAKGKSTTII